MRAAACGGAADAKRRALCGSLSNLNLSIVAAAAALGTGGEIVRGDALGGTMAGRGFWGGRTVYWLILAGLPLALFKSKNS